MTPPKLLVLESHPVQYHAPLYQILQRDHGIDVHVIYGSDCSVTEYRDAEFNRTISWGVDLLEGYDSRFLTKSGSSLENLSNTVSIKEIRKVVMDMQPSVILLLGYHPAFSTRSVLATYRLDFPLMLRAETTDHAVKRTLAKSMIRNIALGSLYKKCHYLLYIGEHSKQHYLRLNVPPGKLVFSPYCVDTRIFNKEKHHVRRPGDPITFIFCGKLISKKGVRFILEALKTLEPTLTDKIKLLLVGDGPERVFLEELSVNLHRVQVEFLGFRNQTQLSECYSQADALILPSIEAETWGLVVNEALYHGLPCIVSDQVGCALDLVHENQTGCVFRSENIADLKDAIQRCINLIHDPITSARCMRLVDKYSMKNAAQGIAEAFFRIVNRS